MLKNKTWRKKMHKTKLIKLLGISLIVGILGLTGFCKKSEDNNNLPLAAAGAAVVQQQAEQAAYEAANNRENPEFFCAQVIKFNTLYVAKLIPLMAQDCSDQGYQAIVGSSLDEYKQKLLNTINNDADLNTNCPNTKNAISNFNPPSGGGGFEIKFFYEDGKSLLSEVGLSPTTYTVVSPNTYKLYLLLEDIRNFAIDNDIDPSNGNQEEITCKNAIQSKLQSFCTLSIYNNSTCSSGQTKVVYAQCAYGSGVPDTYRTCATLRRQF
jgi:hypothetical protein